MKVIVNVRPIEAFEINAGVPQSALFGNSHFLLYINELPKNILRSLVNIEADDNTVYDCTTKNLDEKSLTTDF